MRTLSALGLVMSASLAAALTWATPSQAEVIYPWCLYDRFGGVNCGFVSLQQCMASKGGNTDMCNINGLYQGPPPQAVYRAKKRVRQN